MYINYYELQVLKIISDLRDDRNQLVASFEQYEFIVAALKYYATEVKGHKVLSKPSAVNLTLQQSGESADVSVGQKHYVCDSSHRTPPPSTPSTTPPWLTPFGPPLDSKLFTE